MLAQLCTLVRVNTHICIVQPYSARRGCRTRTISAWSSVSGCCCQDGFVFFFSLAELSSKHSCCFLETLVESCQMPCLQQLPSLDCLENFLLCKRWERCTCRPSLWTRSSCPAELSSSSDRLVQCFRPDLPTCNSISFCVHKYKSETLGD